jgi:uncharacterized protein YqgV (UPF0045/DUF77 family)
VTGISAQVSLYPLRQVELSPSIDDALRIFHAYELQVESGTMSTVITGTVHDVFLALQKVLQEAIEEGDVVMVVTVSNACPLTRSLSEQANVEDSTGSSTQTDSEGSRHDIRSENAP